MLVVCMVPEPTLPTLQILVIGADALSRYVDWTDRKTCILFGDGTGAVVIERSGPGAGCSLLGQYMKSDGHGAHHLFADYEFPDDSACMKLTSQIEHKNVRRACNRRSACGASLWHVLNW